MKRFDLLIDVLSRLRARYPDLRAVIAGEGYELERLQSEVAAKEAGSWLELPGRMSQDELVALYRRAWILTSASSHEGWGMTITEAAACATPAVVTRIVGHVDAVVDGVTGWLADTPTDLLRALDSLLSDPDLRARLGEAAWRRSRAYTWEATARGTLEALAVEARRLRGDRASPPKHVG